MTADDSQLSVCNDGVNHAEPLDAFPKSLALLLADLARILLPTLQFPDRAFLRNNTEERVELARNRPLLLKEQREGARLQNPKKGLNSIAQIKILAGFSLQSKHR